MSTETKITFYGGIHEIGGNKFLVEDKGTRIFLDFGMQMGKVNQYFAEFVNPRMCNDMGICSKRLNKLGIKETIYEDKLAKMFCKLLGIRTYCLCIANYLKFDHIVKILHNFYREKPDGDYIQRQKGLLFHF